MAKPAKTGLAMLDQFEPDVFWTQHGRKILIATGVIVVIGLGLYGWQAQSAREAEQAATALAQASSRPALEQIIRTYPGKEVAAQALLRLADDQFRAADYAAAATQYQRFLDQFPQHPLAPTARLGLAAVAEAEGKAAAAKQQYEQIIALYPNGYATLVARLGVGRCDEALGRLKEARQAYEELLASAQGSPVQSAAYIRWAVLGRDLAAVTGAPPAAVSVPVPAPAVVPAPSGPVKLK